MGDEPQTEIWLVNGQKLTVDGTPAHVVSSLDVGAGRGALTKMTSGDNEVYVNPNHVTHLEEVRVPSSGNAVRISHPS